MARVTAPRQFLDVKCYSSKTVKATDFKFDVHVSRDSPDMTLYKFFEKGTSVKIHLAEICTLTSAFSR